VLDSGQAQKLQWGAQVTLPARLHLQHHQAHEGCTGLHTTSNAFAALNVGQIDAVLLDRNRARRCRNVPARIGPVAQFTTGETVRAAS